MTEHAGGRLVSRVWSAGPSRRCFFSVVSGGPDVASQPARGNTIKGQTHFQPKKAADLLGDLLCLGDDEHPGEGAILQIAPPSCPTPGFRLDGASDQLRQFVAGGIVVLLCGLRKTQGVCRKDVSLERPVSLSAARRVEVCTRAIQVASTHAVRMDIHRLLAAEERKPMASYADRRCGKKRNQAGVLATVEACLARWHVIDVVDINSYQIKR
jgi:hypothetical protein